MSTIYIIWRVNCPSRFYWPVVFICNYPKSINDLKFCSQDYIFKANKCHKTFFLCWKIKFARRISSHVQSKPQNTLLKYKSFKFMYFSSGATIHTLRSLTGSMFHNVKCRPAFATIKQYKAFNMCGGRKQTFMYLWWCVTECSAAMVNK